MRATISGLVIALTLSLAPFTFAAVVVAADDAADPVYTFGAPYATLNGGFGLTPWQHSLPAFPAGSGGPLHAYVMSSAGNDPLGPPLPDIDTFGSSGPVAWGNNADPTGNTFNARRSLTFDLTVGGTYSISYDNGDVDKKEAISWGLNNNNICSFFFEPATNASNYQFTDTLSGITYASTLPQTWGGLRLTLTRDSASTYSFKAVRLEDGVIWNAPGPFAYNTTLVPGIRTLNIFNNDGGNGPGHAMYVNSIEATQLPEPSSLLVIATAGAAALSRRRK